MDAFEDGPDSVTIPAFDEKEIPEQVEILAFMRAKGFSPAGRGAAGRFVRKPGGRGQSGSPPAAGRAAPRTGYMPPRDKRDIKCANCGRDGHAALDCRQPKVERSARLCFTCGKAGHESRACPDKDKARRPVAAVETSGPQRLQSTFCVTAVDADGFQTVRRGLRRAQGQELGDFIREKPRHNSNRFHALGLAEWQKLGAENLPDPSVSPWKVDTKFSRIPSPTLSCFSPISSPSSAASHGRIGATRLMKAQLAETRGGDGGIEPLASEPSGGSGGFCASRLLEKVHLGPWDFHRH